MILAIPEPESCSDESSVAPDSDESKAVPFPWAMVALGIVGWAAAASLLFVYLGQRDAVDSLKSEKVILLAENENIENKANELLEVANSREGGTLNWKPG